ncbi:MAG: class I SAM-dependent methyltransferase [Thermoproteota archaeon]
MEIGVLDGENARKMVEVAIKNAPVKDVEYYGFDFFDGSSFNQVRQKLGKAGCKFKLFKGDTVDTLPRAAKGLPKMDLIFIDGGKSYAEAKSDWEWSKTLMHDGTAIFIHNCYFPGVKRVVDEIPRDEFEVEILRPTDDSDTAMVKKRRH